MKSRSKLFLRVQKSIEEKKDSRFLLFFFSLFFKMGAFLKNALYDLSILPQYRSNALTVSVGSITAGGTGKTPLILALLQYFPKKTAVISRGYRGKFEKKGALVSCGKGPLYSANEMGDEPYLIAKKYPQLHVFVGKNRIQSIKEAEKLGARLLFLDDGMQHRKVKRDIEIVTLKGSNLFGYGYFLPRGYLRDEIKALKRADYIVVEGFDDTCIKALRKYSQAPIIGVKKVYRETQDLQGKRVELPKTAIAFCGIAKPESFFQLLKEKKVHIQKKIILSDHEKLEINDHDTPMICTEKDAVKLQSEKNVYVVVTDLEITYGKKSWNLLVEKIAKKANNAK